MGRLSTTECTYLPTYLSLFKYMASDGHKNHKTGEGLSDFQNCLIPNKRLTPQGLVTGCATGARMAVG